MWRQAAFNWSKPLANYSSHWEPAQQQRVCAPAADTDADAAPTPPTHPKDAVLVPAYAAYAYNVQGLVIEPFDERQRGSLGIGEQFEGEAFPRNEHSSTVDVGASRLWQSAVLGAPGLAAPASRG